MRSCAKKFVYMTFVTITACLALMSLYELSCKYEVVPFLRGTVMSIGRAGNAYLQSSKVESKENSTAAAIALAEEMFMEKMKKRMEERREKIRETCERFDLQQDISHHQELMMVDEQYKVVHCNIGKTGTTRWKEMFWQLQGKDLKQFKVQRYEQTVIGKQETEDFLLNPDWLQSIVVREPFERIVSAYRQKLKAPFPEFPSLSRTIRAKYGTSRDGKFASFSDFVRYLIQAAPGSVQSDNGHWNRFTFACTPCSIEYDFIGHQETIDEDARYFLKLIGAPGHIKHGPPNPRQIDAVTSLEYYANVRPRENVLQLYLLLLPDYIMFGYPPPLALKLLFGNGDESWQ